jgi:short subunit dehydrogenase-like uncharacterized protein
MVRAEIGAPDDLPLVQADATEPASLRSMCERAAVIITTVGPYQLHDSELVAASPSAIVVAAGRSVDQSHTLQVFQSEVSLSQYSLGLLPADRSANK